MARYQYFFDFSTSINCPVKDPGRVPWRVRVLVHRHGLPLPQAAFYAAAIGIVTGENV